MSFTALAQGPTSRASAAPEPSLVYTVRSKDSVIKFTRDMLVNPRAWPEIARFNQLKDPNVIFRG